MDKKLKLQTLRIENMSNTVKINSLSCISCHLLVALDGVFLI